MRSICLFVWMLLLLLLLLCYQFRVLDRYYEQDENVASVQESRFKRKKRTHTHTHSQQQQQQK